MAKGQGSDDQESGRRAGSGVFGAVTSPRLKALHRDMRSAHERVGAFRDGIQRQRASNGDQDIAWLALQEVDIAYEELRVAEEELHEQAEQIAATRQALDAERRRYAELFEKAPDAYLVTDEHGCVVEANHRAGTLFNIDPLFFAGKPLACFISAADRIQFRDLITLMDAARIETQLRIVPHKGQERWVSATAQGRSKGTRERPIIRWLLRDIHDDKLQNLQRAETERDLRDSIDRLEASKHLFEQLCEVAQGAHRATKNVHASQSNFLGEVAQEMRTPLGAIAGWLHVVREEHHGDITRRALMSMTRSVRALAKLVEDLVDNTRYDDHGVKLERTPVNMLRLAVEVAEDLRPLAELKQIQLRFDALPYRIEILADSIRLQQLFRNLLSNAIKFTQPGGSVRIDIGVSQTDAVVTVTDTGRGIAPDCLHAIFEPFMQTDKVHGHENGLGLGLSIARRIAELHGGTISADSLGLGQGSSFRVTLPLTTFN